jgi:molybdopterin-guanine dinucleotide biosynthesis protein B
VGSLTLKICQIVGHKNSGKTTFMGKLLTYFIGEGLACASLKHHGHQEENPLIYGDSGKHLQSGGTPSGLVSPGFSHFSYKTEPPIDAFLAFYREIPGLNWLLIEGYKEATFPKLVLIKDKTEWARLSTLKNILGVVTDDSEVRALAERQFPVFNRNETEKTGHFLLEKESRCERVNNIQL